MRKKISLILLTILVGFSLNAQSWISPTDTKAVELTTEKSEGFQWDKTKYDFGVIEYNKPQTAVFELSNTGEKPIIITKAVGSCGCTGIEYPKTPILPGQKGLVKTIYDAASEGSFNKTVTVYLNTQDNYHVLYISGEVVKK